MPVLAFLGTVTNTNGLMLDLSYPDIRSALVASAKKQRVERQRIGTITREDIDAARQAAMTAKSPVAENQRLRVAVLPLRHGLLRPAVPDAAGARQGHQDALEPGAGRQGLVR